MPRSILPAIATLVPAAIATFAIVCAQAASAATFSGTVAEVKDGPLLVIVDAKNHSHTVRMHALATPVDEQPYYDAGQKAVEHLLLHKRVWVDWFDKKGKVEIGKVFIGTDDVAVRLLQRGAAWYDDRDACDQSVSDRGLYKEAQEDAQHKKLGLWKDMHAVEPWIWQKAARKAEKAIAARPKK